MASSPVQPSTPSEPRRALLNRSFTVPAKLNPSGSSPKSLKAPAEIGATEGVEFLYVHPNASIIKFTSSSRPSSAASGTPNKNDTSQGTLPWASPTERTMAVGQLEIYRVPGSVSFLHSGSLLHAILPRSNCWCVDGVSKFALRVLPDTFYRIELPGETEDDLKAVEELKATLRKVLFFERTPCPFARGFEPEPPPQEPEVKEEEVGLPVDETEVVGKRVGQAKKWRLQGGRSWKPEGWVEPEGGEGSERASEEEEEEDSDEGRKEGAPEIEDTVKEVNVATPSRPRISTGFRSVTAPLPLAIRTPATPSNLRTRVDVDGTIEAIERAEESRTAQIEPPRMRSLQAIPTDMPPSPPDSSAGADYVESQTQASTREVEVERGVQAHKLLIEQGMAVKSDHGPTEALRPPEALSRSAGEDGGDKTEQQQSVRPHEPVIDQPTTFESEEQPEENIKPFEIALKAAIDDELADAVPSQPELESVAEQSEQDNARQDPPPIDSEEPSQSTSETDIPLPNLDASPQVQTSESPLQPVTTDSRSPDDRPSTPPSQNAAPSEDPYAAIQARILARRSIGTTTALPPFQRKSSTTSSSTTSSTLSRRSTHTKKQQQAFTSALVQKACAVFLGPPARLVAIMLKIAARYADAAFGMGSPFYVQSLAGEREGAGVPGSFVLVGEDLGVASDDDSEEGEWEEDDFGVPLRSPVRIAGLGGEGLRGRGVGRGWDVD